MTTMTTITHHGPYHGIPESGLASLHGYGHLNLEKEVGSKESPDTIIINRDVYRYRGVQYGMAFYSLVARLKK